MIRHKVTGGFAVMVLTLMGAVAWTSGEAFANWRGGINGEPEGGVISAEIYVEAEVDQPGVDQIGIETPDGTVEVRKTIDEGSAEIIGTDDNEPGMCLINGKKVGKGLIVCEYLDADGEVLQTANITVHVFEDPNTDEDLMGGVSMLGGTSVNLINLTAKYFDNSAEIKATICGYDEETQAFSIVGNNLTDSMINANNVTWADTVCFYNPYSNGYDEGADAMADSNDEFAQLFVETYKADADESEYGEDEEIYTTTLVRDETVVDDEQRAAFEVELGDGETILGYYEVIVIVKDSDNTPVAYISETGSEREVIITLPDGVELPEVADGYTRVFYVIRDHNGVKEKLPATDNGDGTYTFYSDKFSTFALAYYDVAVDSGTDSTEVTTSDTATAATPDTGTVTAAGASAMSAGIVTVAAVAVIATIAGVATVIRRK